MSKAAELLRKKANKAPKAKAGDPKIVLKEGEPVQFMGGTETLGAVAARWKELDAKRKEIEAELELVKGTLREVGLEALESAPVYYSGVKVGPVVIQRANKFRFNDNYEREEIIDAIGETEYFALFSESASLDFKTIDEMGDFLRVCASKEVAVPGVQKAGVKPRGTFAQRLYDIGPALGEDVLALLQEVAIDQRPSVGPERRGR